MTNLLREMSWLVFDRFVRMGLGIFVSVAIARYLGLSGFGELNYVITVLGLLGSFVLLGMHEVVVRELVRAKDDPKKKNEIIIATLIIISLNACITITTVYFLNLLSIDSCQQKSVCNLILLLALPLQIHTIFIMWFEAHRYFDKLSKIMITSYLLSILLKVLLMILGYGTPEIIFAYAYEPLFTLFLFIIYAIKKRKMTGCYKLNYSLIKQILKSSWPLVFASFAIIISLRIDIVMLNYLSGAESVGIYSAATRMTEVWFFMIPLVLTVAYEKLAAADNSENIFKIISGYLYGVMLYLSVFFAMFFFLAASSLVNLLYGEAFHAASVVIKIHGLCGIPVALSSVLQKVLLIKGHERSILKIHLFSALLNVVFNYFLIPLYAETGAAIATVISYTLAVTFGFLLFKTRLQIEAISFGIKKTPALIITKFIKML